MSFDFTAVGLGPESGMTVVSLAFLGGLIIGMSVTSAVGELSPKKATGRRALRFVFAVSVTMGIPVVLFSLVFLMLREAVAPVIILAGLGFLAGPLVCQTVERMEGSRSIGLAALFLSECLLIAVAANHLV